MSLLNTIETIKLLSAFPNKIVKDTLIKFKKVAKLHIKTLRYKIIIWIFQGLSVKHACKSKFFRNRF